MVGEIVCISWQFNVTKLHFSSTFHFCFLLECVFVSTAETHNSFVYMLVAATLHNLLTCNTVISLTQKKPFSIGLRKRMY